MIDDGILKETGLSTPTSPTSPPLSSSSLMNTPFSAVPLPTINGDLIGSNKLDHYDNSSCNSMFPTSSSSSMMMDGYFNTPSIDYISNIKDYQELVRLQAAEIVRNPQNLEKHPYLIKPLQAITNLNNYQNNNYNSYLYDSLNLSFNNSNSNCNQQDQSINFMQQQQQQQQQQLQQQQNYPLYYNNEGSSTNSSTNPSPTLLPTHGLVTSHTIDVNNNYSQSNSNNSPFSDIIATATTTTTTTTSTMANNNIIDANSIIGQTSAVATPNNSTSNSNLNSPTISNVPPPLLNEFSQQQQQQQPVAGSDVPVKRKRGRPPKINGVQQQSKSNSTSPNINNGIPLTPTNENGDTTDGTDGDKKPKRATYLCNKCKKPKKGHVCPEDAVDDGAESTLDDPTNVKKRKENTSTIPNTEINSTLLPDATSITIPLKNNNINNNNHNDNGDSNSSLLPTVGSTSSPSDWNTALFVQFPQHFNLSNTTPNTPTSSNTPSDIFNPSATSSTSLYNTSNLSFQPTSFHVDLSTTSATQPPPSTTTQLSQINSQLCQVLAQPTSIFPTEILSLDTNLGSNLDSVHEDNFVDEDI
ncbi:hypothetical protein CYY_000604 [Polysphondylium violaceum]|uniref:Uncharacterized protein n=1 Tax=Polysphondylium violaceum TaxID=133409 RepID=A0A8J4Q151_9MYCE|nr:hypothetical protein CYY_000604 [Polysphondylium violaceum]